MFRQGCTDTASFRERVGQTVTNQYFCAGTKALVRLARERLDPARNMPELTLSSATSGCEGDGRHIDTASQLHR